jgi:hypothetical protein
MADGSYPVDMITGIPVVTAPAGIDTTTADQLRPGRCRTYEITFVGRANDTLSAAFDDCAVTVGPNTTTLRAQLPDQAALWSSTSGSSATG